MLSFVVLILTASCSEHSDVTVVASTGPGTDYSNSGKALLIVTISDKTSSHAEHDFISLDKSTEYGGNLFHKTQCHLVEINKAFYVGSLLQRARVKPLGTWPRPRPNMANPKEVERQERRRAPRDTLVKRRAAGWG
jgi:hypothetical protein